MYDCAVSLHFLVQKNLPDFDPDILLAGLVKVVPQCAQSIRILLPLSILVHLGLHVRLTNSRFCLENILLHIEQSISTNTLLLPYVSSAIYSIILLGI